MTANYNQEGLQDIAAPKMNNVLNEAEDRERHSYFRPLSLLLFNKKFIYKVVYFSGVYKTLRNLYNFHSC